MLCTIDFLNSFRACQEGDTINFGLVSSNAGARRGRTYTAVLGSKGRTHDRGRSPAVQGGTYQRSG